MTAHTACLVREHRQRVDDVAETVTWVDLQGLEGDGMGHRNEEDTSYSLYMFGMIAAGNFLYITT